MDQFDVPKAINRHVYKALIYLQSSESAFLTEEVIGQQVKRQWRRNKPTPNMDESIHKSLSNLTDLGILACTGSSSYAVRHTIKGVGQSNNQIVQPNPKIKSVKSLRGINKNKNVIKRRSSIMKPKRISLLSFPNLDTFVVCKECIPVVRRFTGTYENLKVAHFSSKVKSILDGVNNPFCLTEADPLNETSAGGQDDQEMGD
ncbi:uncharacterized protein LOC117789835 [Drosophila innubila]|uniref:uncharacterized protein LOC117789835 n=1 Tax=Drosophila innubila TaxID=198719 RepID=UPI00148D5AF4|nr:uncharacterized protein LOC117789835 [Drosophila innubila]